MSRLKEKLEAGGVYYIAEMSANHANSLDIALAIVDAAAAAGADCLKVQTYTADSITLDCNKEHFLINGGLWDGQRLYDLYSDASFPYDWHEPVRDRCLEKGIDFLSAPFDNNAVDFLLDLGIDAFKIASFELVDIPLIEYAASKGKTMIMSTGMASLEEMREAIEACRRMGNDDVVLLRCCSEYPADPADMNLASIPDMADKLGVPIGFSDHSEGHAADVVAVTLGAKVIEKHICLSPTIETADSQFSMTPEGFADMVRAVDAAVSAVGKPCYVPSAKERANTVFRRSLFASAEIKAGDVFTPENIRIVRPGYGAKPKYYNELIGAVADRDYAFGDPIVYESEVK